MQDFSSLISEKLLQIKAIKLQPQNPFTWASGWKSPIYCDNRKTLSYPDIRKLIANSFAQIIKQKYKNADLIAGVATGAIAIGVLVAEVLNLPFIYVRSSSKGHGLQNQIEGEFKKGQNVVVIEDLVSTGGSSLKAVDALRSSELNVLGMLAIFTYGFKQSENNFSLNNCELTTLSNYNVLIEIALKINYISDDFLPTLKKWRENPEVWGK